MTDVAALVHDWEARGAHVEAPAGEVFYLDRPAIDDAGLDPILVIHGYPSCSYDWAACLPTMSERRRVVLLDLPGFGLSAKPDVRYSIRMYADAVEAVTAAAGLTSVALVTHDMGDTVGGELLARDMEGALSFGVSERVLTNGSIYIDMAQLTNGQQFLLAAPDAKLDAGWGGDGTAFRASLAAICSSDHQPAAEDLAALWAFMSRAEGDRLLARTIRYIEDRRAEEARFTGAIETHPSPLGVVWGALDPVAVYPMTDKLLAARPDARRITLDDVGHFPMLEDAARTADAIVSLLT
ncbi:MAG TPA: alpha/beta hydrolase [Acidimicrobiales bacterium]|nr:alpha/beta hydrolase [Acidimicrobiales bacterium]